MLEMLNIQSSFYAVSTVGWATLINVLRILISVYTLECVLEVFPRVEMRHVLTATFLITWEVIVVGTHKELSVLVVRAVPLLGQAVRVLFSSGFVHSVMHLLVTRGWPLFSAVFVLHMEQLQGLAPHHAPELLFAQEGGLWLESLLPVLMQRVRMVTVLVTCVYLPVLWRFQHRFQMLVANMDANTQPPPRG